MQWEVEQKFAVTSELAIHARLVELGVELGSPVKEADHYFNHPARDFAKTDEALRLRVKGDSNFITYKGPKIDATTKTRKEIELQLPAGKEVIQQLRLLLETLGFRSVATVTKNRQSASFQWEGREVHVTWDEVQDVGTYMEIEIMADDQGLAAAKKALESLANQLGFAASERRSYLELLLSRMA